ESGKRPAVLFAHGHWADGRFHDAGEKAAKASVDGGGEPDVDRGRFFMQALPATLARLGFVVFQYDMVGYADSTAIKHREGFTDAAAELRLQSQMGLQTWNSIRALDFLSGLPDVEAKRIGMTGASGGGTQTFLLAALDDRLACAFPAVMVSTGMQGGCVCENCSYLRVNTGNVEIAALFAPKPMAFSCANDWTKDFVRKGYPELEKLYDLYGKKDLVDAKEWLRYGHQYNVHAREFMYFWMRNHLMGNEEKVRESAFKPVPPKDLSVFDAEHPRPKDELNAKDLRAALSKASDAQLAKLAPKDAESLKEFKRVVGTALRVMIGFRELDKATWHGTVTMTGGVFPYMFPDGYEGMLGLRASGSETLDHEFTKPEINPATKKAGWFSSGVTIPFMNVWPVKGGKKPSPVVVWLHPEGKQSLYQKGKWHPAAKALLDAGVYVFAIDALGTGEQVGEKPSAVDKSFAGYTYGYNFPLLAHRVRDAIAVISPKMVRAGAGKDGPIH
ncbi:MAG: hypothetical protein K2V38_20705, partial [Gemmataceae bacterium]|nr:hypothetical protein [Gemmataceae bacterium]